MAAQERKDCDSGPASSPNPLEAIDLVRPHLQESTGEYRRVQESTGEYRRVQESTGEYRRVQESTGEYRRVQESVRLACHSHFPHDLARIIHNADARFLDRHVESSKIIHPALLLLMLEAASADLGSPSA
jgi:hypothetical protein